MVTVKNIDWLSITAFVAMAVCVMPGHATGNSNGPGGGAESCVGNCPGGGGATTVTNTVAQQQSINIGTSGGAGSGTSGTTTITVAADTEVPKQTPSGPGIASSPTSPCRIAAGLSIGVVGFSGGGFGSVMDDGCDTREDSRFIREVLGDREAAVRRACKKPEIAEALGAVCPKPAPKTVQSAPDTVAISCTTDNHVARRTGAVLCN
jgi:hypothetical protein